MQQSQRKQWFLLLPLLIGCLLLALGCEGGEEGRSGVDPGDPIERDLSEVIDGDTLVVLSPYNTTSYFLYRGEPMGYEYELLRAFAEEQDVVLKMMVVSDRDSLFYLLNQGVGDVAAGRLIPNAFDSAHVAFTEPLYRTWPIVVQRDAPYDSANVPDVVDSLLTLHADTAGSPLTDPLLVNEDGEVPDSIEIEARLITKPVELVGEEVYLPGNSAYYDTLVELEDTLSGEIEIVQIGGKTSYETLIRRVAKGEIELTVSQANLAALKASYFSNIFVRPVIGPKHQVAWAVRANAPELLRVLNAWVAEEKDGALFNRLYDKYFIDRRGYQERVESEYLTAETGTLSDYDLLLQKYAPEVAWDWRLLAAQTYQESRFKPRARSWAGAMGLLQLMPPTAREFGVTDPYDPEDNVRGAVRFLEWLTNYWDDKIADATERRKFILASYNTGHGHVEDARRLTEKYGDDPNRWGDVAYWLLQKSKQKYYKDPVVKYGFCRGLEPVTYVARILDRYHHYQQFVTEQAEAFTEEEEVSEVAV